MSMIQKKFEQLQSQNRTAFMPFITAGDPDLDFTTELIRELDAAGCDLVEIGFPYSDPVADGPVIQASYTRALEQGASVESVFDMLTNIRDTVSIPRVAMISYALVYRLGIASFVDRAIEAGLAGAIVPDLPVEESSPLREVAAKRDFEWIPLIAPTTSPRRAEQIAQTATGFIYYVSVAGITGERAALAADLAERVNALQAQADVPVCVGFGISSPEQAAALASIADGVIVGSAIVKRIAEAPDRKAALQSVGDFARTIVAALSSSRNAS